MPVGPNAAAGSPFAADVAVTDGFETSHALFSWTVTDGIAKWNAEPITDRFANRHTWSEPEPDRFAE